MSLRYFKAVKEIATNQKESSEFDQALLRIKESLEIFKEFQDDLRLSLLLRNRSNTAQKLSIRRSFSELS